MGLVPTFSMADVQKKMLEYAKEVEREIVKMLAQLGEECVNMSRASINIDPSAFPVDDPNFKVKKALKQRVLTKKELAEGLTAPKFGDYLDGKENLRNSIGYFVAVHGSFVIKSGDGEASSIANKVVSEHPEGIALIVVAGMNYAAAVEAKGYNVISSSELFAKSEIPKRLQRVKKKVETIKRK